MGNGGWEIFIAVPRYQFPVPPFRQIWRNDERLVDGILLDRQGFVMQNRDDALGHVAI